MVQHHTMHRSRVLRTSHKALPSEQKEYFLTINKHNELRRSATQSDKFIT
jgi:hypothetical protein